MKISQLMWYLIQGFILVLYLIVFSVLGQFDKTYGYIHLIITLISYITIIYNPILKVLNSKYTELLNFPYALGYSHFSFQVLLSFVIVHDQLNVVASIVALVVYILASLVLGYFNSRTSENLAVSDQEQNFIKKSSIQIKLLLKNDLEIEVKENLERLYDLVSTSPNKSHLEVKTIENQVYLSLNSLKNQFEGTSSNDAIKMIRNISRLMNERNELLKLYQ